MILSKKSTKILFQSLNNLKNDLEQSQNRANALYEIDANKPNRLSHNNPDIIKLYDEFLGERGGHVSHELLHTEYYDKSNVYADAEC